MDLALTTVFIATHIQIALLLLAIFKVAILDLEIVMDTREMVAKHL